MLRLFAQPQKELQLHLKINNNQNHQKIRLHGNLTTTFIQMGRRGGDGWGGGGDGWGGGGG